MSSLLNRVRFTEEVDACLAANDLAPVMASVKAKRETLIKQLREECEMATRRQLCNLCTLFQEFHDVLTDLNAATDRAAAWKRECRFYPTNDGRVACRVNDLEVMCSDNFATSDMLVVTKLTREIRQVILDCMVNKKIYIGAGPAGTGKTESCKDTMRMLCMEPVVFNCSDQTKTADAPDLVKQWRDHAEKSGGKNCAVIFDEFNRMQLEDQVGVLKAFRDLGVFVCITCNPGYEGRVNMDWTADQPHAQQAFTVPPYGDIIRCMLAREGVLECDELGPAIVSFVQGCSDKMSKQAHYDFGMRYYRKSVQTFGALMRQEKSWTNVKASAANIFARIQLAKSVEEDRAIVFDLVKQFLVEVPAEKHSAVDNLELFLRVVHGAAVLGKNTCDEGLTKELNERCKATSTCVKIGSVEENFGPDGSFTKAMRDATTATGRHHIYVCGELTVSSSVWMENLNTVLDDNKVLVLCNGERVPLGDNVRVVFFFGSCAGFSPATVSRLSWVA